jgi:prevent-host-death family protein
MKIASVAAVKSQLSAYLKASEESPVVVTRNGKPVAVLVGLADEDEIERLVLAYSPRFRAIIEAGRRQMREGKTIPHEEFWQRMERDDPAGDRKQRKVKKPRRK